MTDYLVTTTSGKGVVVKNIETVIAEDDLTLHGSNDKTVAAFGRGYWVSCVPVVVHSEVHDALPY